MRMNLPLDFKVLGHALSDAISSPLLSLMLKLRTNLLNTFEAVGNFSLLAMVSEQLLRIKSTTVHNCDFQLTNE